jgi:hypothetical protein
MLAGQSQGTAKIFPAGITARPRGPEILANREPRADHAAVEVGVVLAVLGSIAAVVLVVNVSRRAISTRRGKLLDRTPLARLVFGLLVALVILGVAGGSAAVWIMANPAVGS